VTDLSRLTEAVVQEVLKRLNSRDAGGGDVPVFSDLPGTASRSETSMICVGDVCLAVRTIVDGGASRVACALGGREIESELAQYIDHTLLRPDATEEDIRTLCEEAVRYGFASVCVNSYWVPACADLLRGCRIPVCTVAGFPLGAASTAAKAFEADEAVTAGAEEIDMVINVGELKGKNHAAVEGDIRTVVRAARGKTVKVIIETALLTEEEKVTACVLAREAGADFVKTSTGFAKAGATAEDVRLMRRVVGPNVRIKAAGGIRDEAAARNLIAAGADRLGASASVKIVGNGG
jgi:deoxyribose-phosphate aldolase